jgi:CHASE3 domain sensor protein
LVAAQQEIAAAEKEKLEKEVAAQTLLNEQENMMNSIVEESRKLQKEAEENLKVLSASLIHSNMVFEFWQFYLCVLRVLSNMMFLCVIDIDLLYLIIFYGWYNPEVSSTGTYYCPHICFAGRHI